MPKEYQPQQLDEQSTKSLNNPRDNLSWYQSVAFARWLHQKLRGQPLPPIGTGNSFIIGQNAQVRLPTEWEWQWAAQAGNEKREYPWGAWQADYANTVGSGLSRAIAVGMYPQGAAACGAQDMAGNLWEWCLNKYELDGSTNVRMLRGGSWGRSLSLAACAFRTFNLPHRVNGLCGLRLVVAVPIAP